MVVGHGSQSLYGCGFAIDGFLSRVVTSGLCIGSRRGREREGEREVGGGLPIDNDQVEDKGEGNERGSNDDKWGGRGFYTSKEM